jgi:hypothetical protein
MTFQTLFSINLLLFQVEVKVGLLPKHEKNCPALTLPWSLLTMVPQVEDDMWDFYLSMKNIAYTRSNLVDMFN